MADPYMDSIVKLTGEVGELRGEMQGFRGQIQDLKELITTRVSNCTTCRREIDKDLQAQADVINDSIDSQRLRIDDIIKDHAGERAVSTWLDNRRGQLLVGIGIVSGIVSFLFLTYDWVKKVLGFG